ncbi:MAG: DMT family transporter [Acidobacteria bacterium]|nr:DMT family transporter [Acidobacteriota bacterium]
MNRREVTSKTFGEAAIALVLFACIPVVIRYVSANPFTIGIVRLAIATTGIGLVMRDRAALRALPRADIGRLVIIGIAFAAHWLAYFFAIKASSASIGTIGISTFGIHLLILGAIFGRSRFGVVDVFAVALAIAGATLTVPELSLENDSTLGLLLAILAGFFYATLPILHQRWSHMSSSIRAFGQFAVALVLFLVTLPMARWDLRPIDWAGLAFLGIGSTFVGHGLWVAVTTRLKPSTTSIIYYGNVPIAIALSVTILGEPLTPRIAGGAALIVGGSVVGLVAQARAARRIARGEN